MSDSLVQAPYGTLIGRRGKVGVEFLGILEIAPGDADALRCIEVAWILDAQARIIALDLGERNAPGGCTLGGVERR